MDIKEDQTAPVSVGQINIAIQDSDPSARCNIVKKLLNLLNEKRDSYNGISSSIIYIIDSDDSKLIDHLKQGLIEIVTSNPMKYGGKMFISKVLYRVTHERPQFIADLFFRLLTTDQEWSSGFQDVPKRIRVKVIALKAIAQAEQVASKKLTTLTQSEIDELCDEAMSGCDDATKIDTLCLMLECRSTTKVLHDRELNAFRILFQDALSLQEPSLRQTFLAQTNKLLRRFKESSRAILRDKKKYTDVERQSMMDRYTSFLRWLIDFCLDSIYCNAYFGSFILTMSTLRLLIQHVTFGDPAFPLEPLLGHRRCYDAILSCLNDSFEENKTSALQLLLLLPKNDSFLNDENLKKFEQVAYYLVNSVNPAHSLTCQYVIKLIIGLQHQMGHLNMSKNQLLRLHLIKLITLVEDGIEDTRANLIIALRNNAIYPKLTCICALLNEVDVNDLESDWDEWAKLVSRIVNASIEACEAVSTVVCNLNPETIGHVPMDLKPMSVEALSKSLNLSVKISDGNLQMVSSQMLLISGWKTIKECSLSMGTMCNRFWWPKQRIQAKREKFPGLKIEPILCGADILRIINFFNHYLRNLRHRGAFEQAYNGFIMVTKRIWHDETYRDLLSKSLTDIMNDFKGNDAVLDDKKVECLKAYVTRRSAGLPFIVQAILNSEDKQDSKILRWVMDCLFDVLDDDRAETYQKIHCLNILKALIKESSLGEKVIPYVGKTLAVAMESFRSDSFSIRNCANMLLKATVDRTFGVNRLREDIHRRNKLSYEKFFTQCPELHGEMLRHLRDGIIDRRCLAAVHSVFIILFRLKTSLNPKEGYDCETIIRPFVAPIKELAYTCPDYKLRSLAAQLTVQLKIDCGDGLTEINKFADVLSEITSTLIDEANLSDRNRKHGALLLMKYWLEQLRPSEDEHCSASMHLLHSLARRVILLYTSVGWYRDSNDNTLTLAALEVAESYILVEPTRNNDWLEHHIELVDYLYSIVCHRVGGEDERVAFCQPHLESVIFKAIYIASMSTRHTRADSDTAQARVIQAIKNFMVMPPNRMAGLNLQASLLRLLRQTITTDTGQEQFLDKFLDQMDLDATASHTTPFDKLREKTENDFEHERWATYCREAKMSESILGQYNELHIFDMNRFQEFQFQSQNLRAKNFNSRLSNTPRSIELLALYYASWDRMDLDRNLNWVLKERGIDNIRMSPSGLGDRLILFTNFIKSLPDCDIRCLALLCANRLFLSHLNNRLEQPSQDSNLSSTYEGMMSDFSEIFDDLADGHHSHLMRQTCSEALSQCLEVAVARRNRIPRLCLMNLLSALIKLCQDEEQSIRHQSFSIMDRLKYNGPSGDNQHSAATCRLDKLIHLITNELFDPDSELDIEHCFELTMKIIFNHTKNFSTTLSEERELLFDKSKLNTFADHVIAIQSAVSGLRSFLRRSRANQRIDINTLNLSDELLEDLESSYDLTDSSDVGDYNWRLKKTFSNHNSKTNEESKGSTGPRIDGILENTLNCLEYFANGYWNMLTDTDYSYHELSLFKKIAFIKFILECTNYRFEANQTIEKIQQKLKHIVEVSSSTTMLSKCLNLLSHY